MSDDQSSTNQGRALRDLGPGVGSKVEVIKAQSNYLRGHLAQEMEQDTSRFTDSQIQLLKFHGVYQQEDRDARQSRKAAGAEKSYMMMVRTRIPGGVMTAAQFLAHADLADQFGNGSLRITTRQGIQLHGVLKGDLHPTIRGINDMLLSTLAACGDVNRNVMACPAPVTTRAQAQVQDIAHRIAMHLAPRSKAYHEIWVDGEQVTTNEPDDEPIYGATYLPRKFKIGVAFPGDNCVDIYTQDVGLVAHLDNEELAGFTVIIGGGMGATHGKVDTYPHLAQPLCYAPVDKVLAIVETIVTIQRDYGDRQNRKHARMKYLVAERGIAWFRAEAEQRLGYRLPDPHPVAWLGVDDHLGWHPQAQGLWYFGLFVENGRIKGEGQAALRQIVAKYGCGVRCTGQQNIILTDLPVESRSDIEHVLAGAGWVTDPAALGALRDSMACPAMPTCGLAVAESERALPAIIRQIDQVLRDCGLGNERVSVRMTGCPNGCARPYMGDIGLVGRTRDVYSLFLGGDAANTRLNTLYADSVHVGQLIQTLRPLFLVWRDRRQGGEGFGDFCHRLGVDSLQAISSQLSSV